MNPNAPTYQEAVMRLERFWARQGCVIWQPYNVQVGAGTMNPATVLRVLGPEPWRVAYVEPSIRPADGRYAENPNRWQQFFQYQVILKPDPGDPLEMYLRSLAAMGVDLAKHDIRFVEDNWESPAIGAWGLGWEVWCDGQEITQYTYFQQSGGMVCDPVSVEMTYGLERIVMFMQEADTFLDMVWDEGLTYGDLLHSQEVEHCTYNFEVADVGRLGELFRLYEAECSSALERGLVIPAHDYVLKCSHTFNVLDARGAVGVTERAAFFGRMRDLARRVSLAYVAQREQLGLPFCRRQSWVTTPTRPEPAPPPPGSDRPRDLLLEIGCEELPHDDLQSALVQLRQHLPQMLRDASLGYESIEIEGTPRRLAVMVRDLAPRQAEEERLVKGPPAQAAFDAVGKPTRAAEGFARRHNLPVEALELAEVDGGRYVLARLRQPGQPAGAVLAELLPRVVASLTFNRNMRWNGSGVSFSRPLRWFVALLGADVVPFEYAGVRSGRCSRGFRMAGQDCLEVASAGGYGRVLADAGIVLSSDERRRLIDRRVRDLAASVGGELREDPELLAEVAGLVEAPAPILGHFAEEYLQLPGVVLITVMRKHQRYFAVEREGGLLPYFVAVRNGGREGEDVVRRGNEAVLRARFADASFFYRQDLSHRLEDFLPRMGTLTFQERLGSMLDKTARLETLAPVFGRMLGATAEEVPLLQRAARLAKADLAAKMVVEFTSLQGAIGRVYALKQGEDRRVAEAIYEHYLPRSAGDALPQSRLGLALGLADRLDSILGLFAVRLEPTGSADQFGLRRAALGAVQNLIHWQARIDLRESLVAVAGELPVVADEATQARALAFVTQRLRVYLQEQGLRYDVVDAALAEHGHDPYWAAATARGLQQWVEQPDWANILNAFARCRRIVRDLPQRFELHPERLDDGASRGLYQAYLDYGRAITSQSAIEELLAAVAKMAPFITGFFDAVLVMAEDQAVREYRLALVQHVSSLTDGIVDLSRLEGF